MNENQIINAIESVRGSVAQYMDIMEMFSNVDVSINFEFQRIFNGYYRIRQRNELWYKTYYNYMESRKGCKVTFSDALRHLQRHLGRYEPSFSSKLLATHNPSMPIWDKQVLKSINMQAPNYYSKYKYDAAENIYKDICDWYSEKITSPMGRYIINKFDEIIPNNNLSGIKKTDFVLWHLGT